MAQNATTMWEYWGNSATTFNSGLNSYNHIMYGGTGAWYYTTLVGLRRAAGSRSWSDVVFAPPAQPVVKGGVLATLSWANASIDTPMGTVSAAWRVHPSSSRQTTTRQPIRTKSVYSLQILLPPNARATVLLPILVVASAATATVTESGRTIWRAGKYLPGARGITGGVLGEDGTVNFSVLSGSYRFAANAEAAI